MDVLVAVNYFLEGGTFSIHAFAGRQVAGTGAPFGQGFLGFQEFDEFPGCFLLGRILGEAHQEVAAGRYLAGFAVKYGEGFGNDLEVGALFKVGPFADGGADHAHLATDKGLEAFFVGGVEAAAVFHHICQQLVGLGSFGAVKGSADFAVFLLQHLAAVGFDERLLGPVVGVFLHEEARVAGLFFNDGGVFGHFRPGLGRVVGVKAGFLEQIRVDVEHGHGYGVGQTNLFAAFRLGQGQHVGQEVFLEVALVVLVGQFVDIRVLQVIVGVVQIAVAHLDHVRVFAGSQGCLEILGQALVHIRIVFFGDFNIRVGFVEFFHQLFHGLSAEVFGSHMPVFNFDFLVSRAAGACLGAAAHNAQGQYPCQGQGQRFG